jgi:hypothetical protein
VRTEQSLTINQGSVINANQAGGVGGGIVSAVAGATDQVVISSSTITGNTSANGGGIEVDGNSKANLQLSFNRIVGNNGGSGGAGLASLGTGTVSATDNWWGCNQGPQSASSGCDTVSGAVTSSPWIVLTNSASPTSVLNGATTTVTASFLQDSSNATLAASNLTPLIGLPVNFSPANGILSNVQPTIQPNGTATATLMASATPTASATAQVDNATVTANVTVQDFSISVSAVTVDVGSTSASLAVTVSAIGGFNGVVTLGCGTLPAGITCPSGSFNPATVTGSGTSTLTVNIASSVAPGTYSIPVTGTSSSLSRGGSGSLTLADFSLSISPASATILLGQTATYTVTCSTTTGFSGPVQLSSSLGGTNFNPNPVNCPGTSTLTVTPTATGNFTVPVSGTFGTAPPRSVSASLVVQDFSIGVPAVTVNIGSSTAALTVTVSAINGFNGVVTLACGTMPAGITCPTGAFNPATVTGSGTSTLTVNIASSVAPGTYSIPVTGTSSSVSRSGSGSLRLADFSLSISPPSQTILLGQTATYTVTCSTTTGFSGPVQLSSSLGGTNFNPDPVNCPGTSTLTVTPTVSGNFTVPVSGTFGIAPPRSASVSLVVQDFSIGVPAVTVNIGSSTAALTVTVSAINGFNGVVTLACGTMPAGITCPTGAFNPATVTGSGTSTLTVNIASSVAPGTYSIPVTGTSSSVSRSGSGSLTLADFSLSISPASKTILLGQTATYTVTCSTTTGFSGPVQLSSSLGGTNFNPNPVNCPGTSTLTVTPTATGNFTVPVSGTFGTAPPRSVSASLVVQDFSVSVSSATVNIGPSARLTVTVSAINGFNGVVTLACGTLPAGITCPTGAFNPATVTGSGTSTLTVSIASSVVPGTYSIPVTGTSSGATRGGSGSLTLQDFQLSISPGNQNVTVNGSVNYTVTATSLAGFSGTVSLSCGGSLAGVDISCGNIAVPAGGSGSTTLTVKTSGLTSPGNFQVFANGQNSSLNHSAGAGISVFDSRTWPIGGAVACCSDGNIATFTLSVNGVSESVTYCSPADLPILACEELGSGQPAVNDAATVTRALVNAINGDSSSPANASIVNGALTLTAKTAGTFLRITSADNGVPAGLFGGPSVFTLDTASLFITGTPDGGCCGGNFTSTFSLFVSTNGSNFNSSETVGYCNPTNTPLPGCEEVTPGVGVYSAGDVQQALANAFNSDGASPVRAAITSNGLTLTAKTPGTLLNVAGVDNGFDSTTGAGFTVVQSLNVPNSLGLLLAGNTNNCCGSGFSTVTLTVSANGANLSKSQSYCPAGTAALPQCKLSDGTPVEDVGTAFQGIANQFNSDPNSPVTISFSFGILVIQAKTPGALVAAAVSDDGGSFTAVEVGP